MAGFEGSLASLGIALSAALSIIFFAVAVDHLRAQQRTSRRLARYGLLPENDSGEGIAANPSDLLRRVGEQLVRRASPERVRVARAAILRAGLAGRLSIEELFGLQAAAVLAGGAVGLAFGGLLRSLIGPVALAFCVPAGLVGFVVPAQILNAMAERRRAIIDHLLPDELDVLVVSMEAGIGFDNAVAFLADRANNPLVDELRRYLSDRRLGMSRREALDAMVERTRSAYLREFAASVVQSEELGTGLADALRGQSVVVRETRRLRAEELARQAPIKLMFPMTLFILPVLFIVIIGPAFLMALSAFGGEK